jgi:hypothetical protein
MQSRRQFIGATALASIPAAWAMTDGHLIAQGATSAPTRSDDDASGRVLQEIATENARAYNDIKRNGIRGEHFRVASASLRIFAALHRDDELRRAIRQHVKAHGRDPGAVARHMDRTRLHRDLRTLGMAISLDDTDRLLRASEPPPDVMGQILAPGFSPSQHLRALAALLDKESTVAARRDTGPFRRVIRPVDCDKFEYELSLIAYVASVLCLMGNAPGCLAAGTSIVLIQTAMYYAGC